MNVDSRLCEDKPYGRGCYTSSCTLAHDVKICELCVVLCSPASNYETHVQGRQHLTNLQHSDADPRPVGGPLRRCVACASVIPESRWEDHLMSPLHQRHVHIAQLRALYEQSELDKQGVEVSHRDTGVDFGLVGVQDATAGVTKILTISTLSKREITITGTKVRSRIPNHKDYFLVMANGPSLTLTPGKELGFTVLFHHRDRGRYEARLDLSFQDDCGKSFEIARPLFVTVGEAEECKLLEPVSRYVRGRRAPWVEGGLVLSGIPAKSAPPVWLRQLPHYPIPQSLEMLLRSRSVEDTRAALEEHLSDPPSEDTHTQYFETLLWIEEWRMTDDLRMYDLTGVEIRREGMMSMLHSLCVNGLAEKRPSVTVGDCIMVQGHNGGPTYKGDVREIRQESVLISFHSTFDEGQLFNVRFQLSRTPLRRMHQALVAPSLQHQRLLFPEPGMEGLERPMGPADAKIVPFNSSIATNPHQLQAVKSILHLRPGSAPFIIDGPPGTGKTMAIIEAMMQLLKHFPKARILACAPSNSAADLIALRLIQFGLSPDELFRCNAGSRNPDSMSAELGPYTIRQGSNFGFSSLDTLAKYQVIVTTCVNAAFAYNIGLPVGHFTHIFVDEAGQASEPELLVAIKPLSTDLTRVILSGDPKQLGPVVRSSLARDFDLGKSYLERLMERPLYSSEQGRGTAYVRLVRNYRSHSAILQYPNEKFYDGDLQVCGSPDSINSFVGSRLLGSAPRFPLIFHAISGRNAREASSPSFFNIEEVSQVKFYVDALLSDPQRPIDAHDIGVITPYHAQVRKIRTLFRQDRRLAGIKVGSVEEFQGQERRVIIVSTVRSSGDLLAYDVKFTLGFLSNHRRFNVAVTRAKALLIVVGDATILSVDPLWRGFMNYVKLHNGWRGDDPTWDVNAPVLTDADYADELREAMVAEMNAVIAALPANPTELEQDIEAEANMDCDPWTLQDNADW